VYLTADVVEQRRQVLGLLGLAAGERVLDIGAGPGLLAADMARAVGPRGRVCGIDVSDAMLALARRRRLPCGCRESGSASLTCPFARRMPQTQLLVEQAWRCPSST
jgi:ubiquinone/menaquinone biosynthesis C-methylase UbiE